MIDPGIWTSSSFMSLNDLQQLLFIGLFSNADDYGKITGELISLKARIFPNKAPEITDSFGEDLKLLEDLGMILRYEAEGKKFIWLIKWEKIQKMNYRSISKIPNPSAEEISCYGKDLTENIKDIDAGLTQD